MQLTGHRQLRRRTAARLIPRKRLRTCVAMVLLATLAHASVFAGRLAAASGQNQQAAIWERLPNLPEGTRLRLAFIDGAEITGHLVEARADAVVLEDNVLGKGQVSHAEGSSLKERLTFLRSNVSSVKVLEPVRHSKIRIWAAIGAAAGIAAWLLVQFASGL